MGRIKEVEKGETASGRLFIVERELLELITEQNGSYDMLSFVRIEDGAEIAFISVDYNAGLSTFLDKYPQYGRGLNLAEVSLSLSIAINGTGQLIPENRYSQKGIATMLAKLTMEHLRAGQVDRVIAWTNPDNQGARRILEKMEFKETFEAKTVWYRDISQG